MAEYHRGASWSLIRLLQNPHLADTNIVVVTQGGVPQKIGAQTVNAHQALLWGLARGHEPMPLS